MFDFFIQGRSGSQHGSAGRRSAAGGDSAGKQEIRNLASREEEYK